MHNKKVDKVETYNEWKTMSIKNKKCSKKSNKKCEELEEKGYANTNRFSRLKEILGDDTETHEVISKAAMQDENRKKESNKKY